MDYAEFIRTKGEYAAPTGIDRYKNNSQLFDFQNDIVRWALKNGMAGIFSDCGTGKTVMQLSWADAINDDVLILAPLAVSFQTVKEGEKFGIKVNPCRSQDDVKRGINITNYEMLKNFDTSYFKGVVLDESSILKSFTGRIRSEIISAFSNTKYRLACTATPSPNDFMELGNHSEFLNRMSMAEMLSMFFVHDGGETQKWRLKGHAKDPFWDWLSSFCCMIKKPSDLGYDDGQFILPEMVINQHTVKAGSTPDGFLFPVEALTLQERQRERKSTIYQRAEKCAELANHDRPMLIWCNLNDEAETVKKMIPGAVEIRGSDKPEHKEKAMLGFADGSIRCLVTKPSIAGFGMNWQHCADMAFLGLSDSYEQFYQSVRRCWRFGQKKIVYVNVVTADTEGAVVRNIERKETASEEMSRQMVKYMSKISGVEMAKSEDKLIYKPTKKMEVPKWM